MQELVSKGRYCLNSLDKKYFREKGFVPMLNLLSEHPEWDPVVNAAITLLENGGSVKSFEELNAKSGGSIPYETIDFLKNLQIVYTHNNGISFTVGGKTAAKYLAFRRAGIPPEDILDMKDTLNT